MRLPRVRFVRREKALTATPAVLEALQDRRISPYRRLGGSNLDVQNIRSAFVQAQSASYAFMYGTQPAVRSVVDYIARNIAQLGVKTYRRISDDEREHEGDHPAAVALREPNPQTPGQQFVFNLVADFLVYDNAYALKFRPGGSQPLILVNLPAHAVGIVGQQRFTVDAYRIFRADGSSFDVEPEFMLHWRGYNPEDPKAGFSKLETLRQELAADAAARTAKTELDKSGLLPKGWIERPLEAPEWDEAGMRRFMEQWANMTANSTRRSPVLEEGMVFKQAGVSPEEAQMLEGREFTRREVASLYGLKNIPPEGEEERRQAYVDVLRPYCEMLCAYFDLQILRDEYHEDDLYTEFNIDEKLMGEDRMKALTSASGVPPLTRNEARAKLDLPPVEGGDEPITPANVIVGSNPKPSPQVMPIQDPNRAPQDGSHRTDDEPEPPNPAKPSKALEPAEKQLEVTSLPRLEADMARQRRNIDKVRPVFERHYQRQRSVLKDKKTLAKAANDDHWNRKLADEIERVAREIVENEGGIYSARLGADDFDMRQVENYLKAMAEGAAQGVNDATQRDIDDLGLDGALDRAQGLRSEVAAASIGTRATVFARTEAAKQAPNPERRMKTWIADTARHADLHGKSVPLDRTWGGIEPGSQANCKCSASIS